MTARPLFSAAHGLYRCSHLGLHIAQFTLNSSDNSAVFPHRFPKTISERGPAMKKRYWFPVKRYGWGWGPPTTWEGWCVLLSYVFILLGICFWLPPHKKPVSYSIAITCITLVLLLVVWKTGEPPRWRWGEIDTTEDAATSQNIE